MSRKNIILLILASFFATLAVFKFVRNGILGDNTEKDLPATVTFTEHIAPILYSHCVQCHRPSGSGPFPLITYEQVMRKKRTIQKVIKQGIMPPWPADPTYTHFIGENVLTDFEKQLLYKWANDGYQEGMASLMPDLPKFNDLSNLGEPDVTIYLDSILLRGNNRDKFLVVKTPFQIARDTFIRAIEFIPGKHNVVHHLNGHLINYDFNKKQDVMAGLRVIDVELHPDAFLEAFEAMRAYNDDGSEPQTISSAINYLPGVVGTLYPEGIGGFEVKRKAALYAKNLHYGPVQEDKWDRSHYNIFFSKSKPSRPTSELMLGSNGVSTIHPPLVIPPDTVMTFTTRYRLLGDISVLTINPHMHLLGEKFLAYAVTREKDTIPLIRINRWDFRWQYFYTFERMVHLPKGSTIVVEGTFNNTASNPNNPHDPPKTVSERLEYEGGSMRTTDEMFQFIISYLPYKQGDENISLKP